MPLLLAALLTVVFYSCRDEDLLPSVQSVEHNGTRNETESTSGLDVVQDEIYGATYKPNCRVPLVGEGRVINQITKNLVGVLSNSDNKLEYLVDKNLDNSVSLKGLAELNTGLPILSVRDVNRVYYDSNGIKVGFLYKDPGGLLSLDVLKGFWVKTYLKGEEQDGSSTSGSGDKFQLLNLNLLNVSGGLSEISFTTTKPFDEVRIGCASISVEVLSGLEFYYAFVGENPKKIAAKEHEYPDAKQERPSTNITDLLGRNLVDSDISNGPTCELLSGLVGGGLTCRVNFGATIPVGSEVGYYTTGGGLASISLGATELNAYDTSDNNPQSINTESGIGVSALAGGAREFSMILTKENAQRLELDLPSGINLLSAVQVHYAYSRDPVEIDVSSYFTIGNDTISTDYYDLPTPSEGSVTYSLISWPSGATSPSISGNHMTGMTVMVTM